MRLDVWRREINFSISYAQLINIFLIVGGCIQTFHKGDLILVLFKYYVRKKMKLNFTFETMTFWNSLKQYFNIDSDNKAILFLIQKYQKVRFTLILLIWNDNYVYSIMLLDFEITILRCILQNVKNKLLWLALLHINKAGVEIFIEMTIIIYQLTVCVCMCFCIYFDPCSLELVFIP